MFYLILRVLSLSLLLAIVSAPAEWPMHVFHAAARPCPVTFRRRRTRITQKKLKIMAACRRISIQRRETIRRDHMPSRKSTRCREETFKTKHQHGDTDPRVQKALAK